VRFLSAQEVTAINVGCAGDWCAVRRGEKTVVILRNAVSKMDHHQIVEESSKAALCPPAMALS
jgi:hypothetical protein